MKAIPGEKEIAFFVISSLGNYGTEIPRSDRAATIHTNFEGFHDFIDGYTAYK
jgi:hypothetical protein